MIAAALILALALPQSAQQFDLICEGQIRSTSRFTAPNVRQVTTRYSLDLDAMLWCETECAHLKSIQSVSVGSIVLADADNDLLTILTTVNRLTGEMSESLRMKTEAGSLFLSSYQCERAAFSGLPTARF